MKYAGITSLGASQDSSGNHCYEDDCLGGEATIKHHILLSEVFQCSR
jgi:hypothetical protein